MVGRIAWQRLASMGSTRSSMSTPNMAVAVRPRDKVSIASHAMRSYSPSAQPSSPPLSLSSSRPPTSPSRRSASSTPSRSLRKVSAKASGHSSRHSASIQIALSPREQSALTARERIKAYDAEKKRRAITFKEKKVAFNNAKLVELRRAEIEQLDPILGHSRLPEGYAYWQRSELCQLLLTKDEVWGVRLDRRGQLVNIDDDTARERAEKLREAVRMAPKNNLKSSARVSGSAEHPVKILNLDESAGTRLGPKRVNFGLDTEEDRKLLFAELPAVILEDQTRDLLASMDSLTPEMVQIESKKIQQSEEEERSHVDLLSRILDLRNASSKGIFNENVRRIVSHFGTPDDPTKKPDTGSVEVQTAILTYRVRSALELLIKGGRKNFQSKRSVLILISQRAKLLRYLRNKDARRYDALLPRIGVVHEAVSGDYLALSKAWNFK